MRMDTVRLLPAGMVVADMVPITPASGWSTAMSTITFASGFLVRVRHGDVGLTATVTVLRMTGTAALSVTATWLERRASSSGHRSSQRKATRTDEQADGSLRSSVEV